MKKFTSIVEAIPDEQILLSAGIRIAHLCVNAGETDKALSILEKLLEEQGPDLPYVTTGIGHFKKLEKEPRFLAIVDKLGLPPPLPS
jgi:hypothetical protein